jgi:hypothetical protein
MVLPSADDALWVGMPELLIALHAQQHIQCAGTAIALCCGAECKHVVVLSQPAVQAVLQDRRIVRGAIALAVDDAYAA